MYMCIDLKSFYASVECVIAGYDPFKVALVVADSSRGEGAITLAATPYIKSFGVKSRGRLYEIPKNIKYICQKPRMNLYLEYSCLVYEIYLKYFSKEDIYVYSIDEVFINIKPYKNLYKMSEKDLAKIVIDDIYNTLGLTATAGIGENMYLAKIALDIISKHTKSNIGYLDQEIYIKTLSNHRPLSDFWQIGGGIEARLNKLKIYDMKGIRETSKKILYKEFGEPAKYLINHAYGLEDVEMEDVKKYTPKQMSISKSQILERNYSYNEALIVLCEMIDEKVCEMCSKNISAKGISLTISYDNSILKSSTGGSRNIALSSNLFSYLKEEFKILFEETTLKNIPIRRIWISFYNFKKFNDENLFSDIKRDEKEKNLHITLEGLKKKYGRGKIFKAVSLYPCATNEKRSKLLGGHNRE